MAESSQNRWFVRILLLIAVTCSGATWSRHALAQWRSGAIDEIADLEKLQNAFQRLAENVKPTVVSIETFREVRQHGDRIVRVPNSLGSGFVFRADGYLVTNHHVIEGADRIMVMLFNGNEYEAGVVQFDPRSDLAIIKIDTKNLRVAPLADLSEVRQGQWAFTVGNPFGLANRTGQPSFSYGVVSAIGRSLTDRIVSQGKDRYYGNLIETDASINPGNSGGPLFNIHGRVIGVSTAMVSGSGVTEGAGFAVPMSKRTRRILNTLADGEVARYGYLGVVPSTPDRQLALRYGAPKGRGAMIDALAADPDGSPVGPAAEAGLRPKDIITKFDGTPIRNEDDLFRVVGSTPVGSEVRVVYYRDNRRRIARVTLAERAQTAAARIRSIRPDEGLRFKTWRGAILVEPTLSFLSSKGLPQEKPGLYVAEVPEKSQLSRLGLHENTFIVRVNGHRIRTIEDFNRREHEATGDIRLKISDGTTIVVRD